MPTETSNPIQAGPDKIYQDGLVAGRFILQHCTACGSHVFYPRHLCPECGSVALDWVEPSGRGTVYSMTIVRQRPESGGNKNLAIVELAEGPRLLTRIEGIAPEEVTIGLPVAAEIAGTGEEPRYLVFRPVGSK